MAQYKVNKNHIIYKRLIQLNKKPKDLCRVLGINEPILTKWINNPGLLTLNRIMAIAGFLKLDYDFLIYYLVRCKSIGKYDKKEREERDIQAIRDRNSKYSFID